MIQKTKAQKQIVEYKMGRSLPAFILRLRICFANERAVNRNMANQQRAPYELSANANHSCCRRHRQRRRRYGSTEHNGNRKNENKTHEAKCRMSIACCSVSFRRFNLFINCSMHNNVINVSNNYIGTDVNGFK